MIDNAWDVNYKTTMWLVTVFGFLDLFLSFFSYFKFGFTHYYAVEDRLIYERHTYDKYGCDEAGLDVYGNEFPTVDGAEIVDADENTTDS